MILSWRSSLNQKGHGGQGLACVYSFAEMETRLKPELHALFVPMMTANPANDHSGSATV